MDFVLSCTYLRNGKIYADVTVYFGNNEVNMMAVNIMGAEIFEVYRFTTAARMSSLSFARYILLQTC